jgi:hypothetical protein
MMHPRLGVAASDHRRTAAASVLLLVALCAGGCEWMIPAPEEFLPTGGVTLQIKNESGLDLSVEIVYLEGSSLIRRTQRLLLAYGAESAEEIVPTVADTVIATAYIAEGTASSAALTSGGLMQTAVYRRGVDYEDDGTIVFTIAAAPAPEPEPCSGDCIIIGDLNADHVVDLADVPLFNEVLLGRNQDPVAIRRCDFNLDGVADGRDLQGFTACLAGQSSR